jgi:hypothetical protein
MFVGHYGVSFAAKRLDPSIPLWVLFVAAQLLDVIWGPLVMLGIEKVRIIPGFTASNPLDLYYMPYTHSLLAALLWSLGAWALYRWLGKPSGGGAGGAGRAALIVGLAVLSHWVLDVVVHTRDLALYDDTAKVGLGLWNVRSAALALELATLAGGLWMYLGSAPVRRAPMLVFGAVLVAIQLAAVFGPPPATPRAVGGAALAGYVVLTAAVALLERARRPAAPGPA